MTRIIESDVLVVGGGGAAARAAVEAHHAGAKVVLAVKGRFGAVGTRGSGATAGAISELGGMRPIGMPDGPPSSGRQVAFDDIVQAGLGVADRQLVEILTDETWDAMTDLREWGATFGGLGIKSHGLPIMTALEHRIRQSDIIIQQETMIVSLLVEDGTCQGAVGISENGGTCVFKAAATILGTGGNGQLFARNLHPSCVTGDGYAMGYEAGAELMNMEFNQIFQGTVFPTINMLTTGWMWQHYPSITNANGEEFIHNYLPAGTTVQECMDQRALHFPFSTRDTLSKYIDIAIIKEILAGRGNEHNAVYIDLTDPNMNIPSASREFYEYRGIDMTKEPVEVSIFLHCSNGGLVIDENAQTKTPGLFAAGEVAAGPHGADRLGGNMLAASQVFGKIAGRHAAQWAKQTGRPSVDEKLIRELEQRIHQLEESGGDRPPSDLIAMLQKLAWENMLLTRSKDNLGKVLDGVEQIRTEMMPRLCVSNSSQLVEALELQNRLQVAEIMARPALLREESRGGHYREDFPQRDDDKWLKAITVKKNAAGQMETGTKVVDPDWKDREGDMGSRRWG